MKKRPYFKTAERVVAAFDRNPRFSSGQLGKLLGLNPGYVRKALHRNGRHTKGKSGIHPISLAGAIR